MGASRGCCELAEEAVVLVKPKAVDQLPVSGLSSLGSVQTSPGFAFPAVWGADPSPQLPSSEMVLLYGKARKRGWRPVFWKQVVSENPAAGGKGGSRRRIPAVTSLQLTVGAGEAVVSVLAGAGCPGPA